MAVIVGAFAGVVAAVLIEKNLCPGLPKDLQKPPDMIFLCRGGHERKREHARDNEYRRWRESLHRIEFRTMFA